MSLLFSQDFYKNFEIFPLVEVFSHRNYQIYSPYKNFLNFILCIRGFCSVTFRKIYTANLNENAYKFDARSASHPSNLSLGFQIYDNNIFCKKIYVTRYVNSRSIQSRVLFYPFKDLRGLFSGTCACNYLTDQRSWLIRDIFEFSVIRMWSLSFSTRNLFFFSFSFNIFTAYV